MEAAAAGRWARAGSWRRPPPDSEGHFRFSGSFQRFFGNSRAVFDVHMASATINCDTVIYGLLSARV